jgi:lipopolysaccharide transport system ATP-binding protein
VSDPVITVENLGKRYTLRHQAARGSLREKITSTLHAPVNWLRHNFAEPPATREEFWALRDINFSVQCGEVVGIIGRNGAGKSTLLKILSRITEPAAGRVTLRGRVASLLEVGTGFHPELTGRENIFLNGAILGMTRAEIRRKFDEIVAFAEVERFIDMPVKYYSSGMYVRLAFAVAAHLEPEILIIDEVLAVGDTAFQQKCLGKIGAVARGGRTVLFVSHNMAVVQNLCSRAILMQAGRLSLDASAQACVSEYLRNATEAFGEVLLESQPATAGSDLGFMRVAITDPCGRPTAQVNLSSGAYVELDYRLDRAVRGAQIVFELWNEFAVCVLCSTDFDTDPQRFFQEKAAGRYRARCHIPHDFLRPGTFTLHVSASVPNVRPLADLPNVIGFQVIDDGSVMVKLSQGRRGIVLPILPWESTPF